MEFVFYEKKSRGLVSTQEEQSVIKEARQIFQWRTTAIGNIFELPLGTQPHVMLPYLPPQAAIRKALPATHCFIVTIPLTLQDTGGSPKLYYDQYQGLL
jgi:hypothetical protein